jgi:hypothetical protein
VIYGDNGVGAPSGGAPVLIVLENTTVTIRGVTITGAHRSTHTTGGGLINLGTLTLRDTVVTDNSGAGGGGIANLGGDLTIRDSLISQTGARHSEGELAERFTRLAY